MPSSNYYQLLLSLLLLDTETICSTQVTIVCLYFREIKVEWPFDFVCLIRPFVLLIHTWLHIKRRSKEEIKLV